MKTDQQIDAMAEQWKLEHGMQIQLPPLAYYSQVQAFKSGYKAAQSDTEISAHEAVDRVFSLLNLNVNDRAILLKKVFGDLK